MAVRGEYSPFLVGRSTHASMEPYCRHQSNERHNTRAEHRARRADYVSVACDL